MPAKQNGSSHDAMPYFLEILSGLGPGDESFVDLGEAGMDRIAAEELLRSAAEELGMEIEVVPSALVFRVGGEDEEVLPPPSAAWLLLGDESSLLERSDLDEITADDEGDGAAMWTGLPNIAPGDLLFFYFQAPHDAVRFIARAVERPVWEGDDEEEGVDEELDIEYAQWWIPFSSIVEVEPIGRDALATAFGGRFDVPAQYGMRLPGAVANRLLDQANITYAPHPWCAEDAMERVYAPDTVPAPADMTLDDLRDMPSAELLDAEAVGTQVVEPLLRLCRIEAPEWEVRRNLAKGKAVADYAVLSEGKVRSVILVAHRIRMDSDAEFSDSLDVEFAAERAEAFDAPYLLVDCDLILLFDPLEEEPYLVMDRFDLDDEDLEFIRAHLTDEEV
jgi:hypothetical protein